MGKSWLLASSTLIVLQLPTPPLACSDRASLDQKNGLTPITQTAQVSMSVNQPVSGSMKIDFEGATIKRQQQEFVWFDGLKLVHIDPEGMAGNCVIEAGETSCSADEETVEMRGTVTVSEGVWAGYPTGTSTFMTRVSGLRDVALSNTVINGSGRRYFYTGFEFSTSITGGASSVTSICHDAELDVFQPTNSSEDSEVNVECFEATTTPDPGVPSYPVINLHGPMDVDAEDPSGLGGVLQQTSFNALSLRVAGLIAETPQFQRLGGPVEAVECDPNGGMSINCPPGGPVLSDFQVSDTGISFDFSSPGGTVCAATLFEEVIDPIPAIPVRIPYAVSGKLEAGLGPEQSRLQQSEPTDFERNGVLLLNAEVLPHIPFGIAGDLGITTQIIVNNPHLMPVEGGFSFFNSADGQPLSVSIDGNLAAEHSFEVEAGGSRLFEIDPTGVDPVRIAWGLVWGEQRLSAASDFLTRTAAAPGLLGAGQEGGTILAEAGIAASGVSFRHILNVSRDATSTDTALAVVNPTAKMASISARLRPTEGPEIPEQAMEVGPQQQTAVFFGQLFGLPPGPFTGTLELNSDVTVAVMSLRTLDGLQSASLPAASP